MVVKSVCIACGYIQPLQAGLQYAQAKKAMAGFLLMAPGLADHIAMYLDLFSPGERVIRNDRLAKLIRTIGRCESRRDRTQWPRMASTVRKLEVSF